MRRLAFRCTLRLQPRGVFIEWAAGESAESVSEWVLTSGNSDDTVTTSSSPTRNDGDKDSLFRRWSFTVDIKELRSFYCHEYHHKKNPDDSWIRLIAKVRDLIAQRNERNDLLQDGSNYIPLYFRGDAQTRRKMHSEDDRGVSRFIASLQRYALQSFLDH